MSDRVSARNVKIANRANLKDYVIIDMQKINNTKIRADTRVRPYRRSFDGSRP